MNERKKPLCSLNDCVLHQEQGMSQWWKNRSLHFPVREMKHVIVRHLDCSVLASSVPVFIPLSPEVLARDLTWSQIARWWQQTLLLLLPMPLLLLCGLTQKPTLPRLHPQHQWKVVLESQCCLLLWELQQGPVLGSGHYTNTLICQHLFLLNFSIDSIEFMNSCKMSNHPTGCHFNLVEVSLTKDTISIFFVCLRAIVHFLQLAVH